MRRLRRPWPALAAMVVLLGAGGCASGRLAPGGDDAASNLVTQADVARWPAGSAERAFVGWWRDVQYANYTGFTTLVRRRPAPAGKNVLVDYLASLTLGARPTAISARRSGTRTDLHVTVTVLQSVGAGKVVDQRFRFPVRMRRVGAGWLAEGDYTWASALAAVLRPYAGGDRG